MHWLDGLYRLVYSTAMREITRSISYSEMERLGIERIIILECGVYDCTPIYTSRQNARHPTFLTSLTSSSSDRPLATFAQTPEVRQQHKQQVLNSAAAAEQQAMLLSPLTQSDSHTFAHLRSLNPFADIRQKFTLEGSSSRTSSLSAKKNNPQTTRNSDEILTPPCQMFLGH